MISTVLATPDKEFSKLVSTRPLTPADTWTLFNTSLKKKNQKKKTRRFIRSSKGKINTTSLKDFFKRDMFDFIVTLCISTAGQHRNSSTGARHLQLLQVHGYGRHFSCSVKTKTKNGETKRKCRNLQISVNFKRRLLALCLSVTITSSISAGKNYICPRTLLRGLTTPLQKGRWGKRERLFHHALTIRRNTPRFTK